MMLRLLTALALVHAGACFAPSTPLGAPLALSRRASPGNPPRQAALGSPLVSAGRLRGGRAGPRMMAAGSGPVELWGAMGTRSPLVNWYLHELGAEFVDRGTKENPNPFGSIPCLRDGDEVVFESGAILLYLAEKFGKLDTPKRRADAYKWVTWANASLDPVCFIETPEGKVIDTQLRGSPKAIAVLENLLATSGGPYLGGEEFSVADVAVASYLLFVPQFFQFIDLSRWPNVSKYMLRCAERPAYGRAFGPPTQMFLVQACQKFVSGKTEEAAEKRPFGFL